MIAVAWLLAGIAALIGGSELLTRGGIRVAARLGIPPIIIGLTVVSVGTSTPELAVGIDAALQGNGGLVVGNIAGTNTVNILLILGLSALLDPLALKLQTLRLDLPCMVAAALVFTTMSWNGLLSRLEGAILLSLGLLYTILVVSWARRENHAMHTEFNREFATTANQQKFKTADTVWSITALISGIVIVVIGADWFVEGAVGLARLWGVSETFIGLTIVAVGTSAPELFTTIIGTLRKERDIAVGNLLGSSVYNIVVILGATCLVPSAPLLVAPELIRIDIPVMTAVAFLCVPVFMSGRRVTRLEGAAFVATYITYILYLILQRTP